MGFANKSLFVTWEVLAHFRTAGFHSVASCGLKISKFRNETQSEEVVVLMFAIPMSFPFIVGTEMTSETLLHTMRPLY